MTQTSSGSSHRIQLLICRFRCEFSFWPTVDVSTVDTSFQAYAPARMVRCPSNDSKLERGRLQPHSGHLFPCSRLAKISGRSSNFCSPVGEHPRNSLPVHRTASVLQADSVPSSVHKLRPNRILSSVKFCETG